MRSILLLGAGVLAPLWLAACTNNPGTGAVERAEFGILYGGQVQERQDIPFVLDRTKQTIGFVIALKHPAREPLIVEWEVSKPGARRETNALSDPLNRRAELFEGMLAAGQREFNQTLEFEPGDALGLWNVRVVVGHHIAIDRPFMVYDPIERNRRLAQTARLDGGVTF